MNQYIEGTGATHDMEPNYRYFPSYYNSSSGEYIVLVNEAKKICSLWYNPDSTGGGGGHIEAELLTRPRNQGPHLLAASAL